ncbi:small multidrug resistance protein [Gracilibacillus halophilus YIM-C55.5]|uniref:Small multidrug resistance protein n=1 Tax=Gracilibacillus halophilus YIM-C55.5 TaxID=1308866 RepID=N4WVC9_9BACI|nr:multidrug efflux SMR transporter [Gracilibacillus halophilus]ENH97026.1 small multidrug resistance protein [Gracilibacillus halophilus YIM-C55.5]
MAWISLIIAGIFEMFGVLMIHKVHQNPNVNTVILLMFGFTGSFLFLALAMRSLPMGTSYAVWTGIGASGAAIMGMIIYGESRNWKRVLFIALILTATIGLKLTS